MNKSDAINHSLDVVSKDLLNGFMDGWIYIKMKTNLFY